MDKKIINLIIFAAFVILGSKCITAEESYSSKNTYITGWYLWDPYQYMKMEGDVQTLTGLDVQLVREIVHLQNKEVQYESVSWKQHQLDLKTGARDFAAGATYTEERAEYVYYSKPYRFEENSLFVRRGEEDRLNFSTIDELLASIESESYRLGVVEGFIYADPKINAWIHDPKNRDVIDFSVDDYGSLKKLLAGKIDGFLSDRLVGATAIWRGGYGAKVNEITLDIKTPIHLIFSKKTISPAVVEEFNRAIDELHESKIYNKLISWYLHPVLLLQTVDALWFRIVEFIGTVAFAISGLIIAYRDRSTVFGALIFAMLPSMGGGIIRDVIFDRFPVTAVEFPIYLYAVLSTVFIGFILIRLGERFHWHVSFIKKSQNFVFHLLALSDALGFAAFTVSGIVISVMVKVDPLWLWGPVFALVTGVGGAILRDLISKQREILILKVNLMPEIVLFWAFLLSVFLTYQSSSVETDLIKWAVITTVAGVFFTRVLIYVFKIPNFYFRNPKKFPPAPSL